MKKLSVYLKRVGIGVSLCALLLSASPQQAEAASASQVREAQRIMTKLGLPTGPVDGIMGPQTRRGLCAFRYISGQTVTRSATISATMMKNLRDYNKKYSSIRQVPEKRNNKGEYMLAHKTCQVIFHANKGKFTRAMPMSSGDSRKGKDTPNGTYTLHNTRRGWHCSNLYPESCRTESTGRFANKTHGNYGNMYNMRWMGKGGLYVHGSMRVPTHPGSAGCIRMNPKDSDWMWDNVGNNGRIPLYVVGNYKWN